MDIIADPNIYELADSQMSDEKLQYEHYNYLLKVISFIKDINERRGDQVLITLTDKQYHSICNPMGHPWNQYKGNLTLQTSIIQTYGDLIKLINKSYCDLGSIKPAEPCAVWNYNTKSNIFDEFLKQINFFKANLNDHTFLLGIANNKLKCPLNFKGFKSEIHPISDVNDVSFSNGFRNLITVGICLEPSLTEPFPNKKWCANYDNVQKDLFKNKGCDKIKTYRDIVCEVALRNGYIKEDRISRINSIGCIRDIYVSHCSSTVYISADVRHGRIEVFNSRGKHQGEYTYAGVLINESDISGNHDIKVK